MTRTYMADREGKVFEVEKVDFYGCTLVIPVDFDFRFEAKDDEDFHLLTMLGWPINDLRNSQLADRREVNKQVEQIREITIGDVIVYHNPVGKPFKALITAVWSKNCINVVIVSGDETRTDSYGRQIERVTSLMHGGSMTVHGNYWRFEDEEANPVVAPEQK